MAARSRILTRRSSNCSKTNSQTLFPEDKAKEFIKAIVNYKKLYTYRQEDLISLNNIIILAFI